MVTDLKLAAWTCQSLSALSAWAAVIKICLQTLRWLIGWLYYVCLICLCGACLGVLTHVLYGLFFVEAPDYAYLSAFGFQNGLTYAGVWAGGAAIVLCVVRARREYLERHAAEKD